MTTVRKVLVAGMGWALALTGLAVVLASSPAQAATLTWTVGDLGDGADASPGNGTCATSGGVCTLRAAIGEANAHPGDLNRIHFSVAGTIQTTAATPQLPEVTAPGTVFDGTTAPGFASAPVVTIRGTAVNPGYPGLLVKAANVTVRGLRFGFWGRAIQADSTASGLIVKGNQLGTNGTTFDADLAVTVGVKVYGPNAVIGGPAAADRNVISGFLTKGIDAQDPATGGLVEGNYIGTNAAGTASTKHPNGTQLTIVDGNPTPNVGIETTANSFTVRGNLVSGNAGYGIGIHHVSDAVVVGNLIGVAADGSTPLGNIGVGIGVQHAGTHPRIGGTAPGEGNVIAATQASSFAEYSAGAGIAVELQADATVVGNWIGTNAAGADLSNKGPGISVADAGTDAAIGGTAAGSGNVIVATNKIGIDLKDRTGSEESTATILGNRIGTNPAGTAKVGSTLLGVAVGCGTKVQVGGTAAGAGNQISGAGVGIGVCDAKRGTTIQGNRIGTNAAGTATIPNGKGIVTGDAPGSVTMGSTRLLIGGTAAGAGNLVSGNGGNATNFQLDLGGAVDVQGNRIGTNAAGTAALDNTPVLNGTTAGINARASGIVIGGSAAGAGNLLSGFSNPVVGGGYGILISSGPGTVVKGNTIGTDLTGTNPIPNNLGIGIQNSPGTVIGGVAAGEGNLIANSKFQGAYVFAPGSGVTIRGNRIHTNGLLPISLHYFYSEGGGNQDQLPPTMTATIGAQTAVSGTVRATVAGPVLVDVYASNTCADDSSGEAKQYLGTISVNHPGGGAAQAFSGTVPAPAGGNTVVTATATVAGVGTSQFSECAPYSDLAVTATPNATKAPLGTEVAGLVTITNRGPNTAHDVVAALTVGAGPTSASDEYLADPPSVGTVDHDAGTWTIPTLPSGASASVCLRQTLVRETYPWEGFDFPAYAYAGANTFAYPHDPRTGNDENSTGTRVGPLEGANPAICPLPTLSLGDAQLVRPTSGTASMTFTVTLSAPQSRAVTVKYATQNGTGAAVIDFVAAAGTVTIPAGQTSAVITVPIVGNQSDEPDKQFTLLLSEPVHATVGDGSATGTIKANGALAGCPTDATKNEAFVCHLYFDALNRPAESGGFTYWVNRLNRGDPRANMAKAYFAQPESRRVLVNRIFVFYLGRNGTAAELKGWADKLAAKTTTPEAIRISLLASSSYYSRAGATAEGWVLRVYRDVFRRDPDASGKQYWLGKLTSGQSRTQVATGMLTTSEGRRRVIDDIFLRFVRRFPPQSESTPWVNKIKAGKTELDISIAVVASNEYYARP